MGDRVAEQHAVRDDYCRTPTHAQEIEHQPHEQQLTFGGDGLVPFTSREALAVGAEVTLVYAPGERRISQNIIKPAANCLLWIFLFL